MAQQRLYANAAERQAAYRQRQDQASTALRLSKAVPSSPAIGHLPGEVRWKHLIHRVLADLETVQQEMQDYYDERTERWQENDRGCLFLERCEALEEAVEAIQQFCAGYLPAAPEAPRASLPVDPKTR